MSRSLATLLVALLATAVIVVRAGVEGERKFSYPDSFHYAEMGRQLARGEGFTSLQAFPYSLAWMRTAGVPTTPPWPNVTRFPLLTVLYAPVFWLAGATDGTALLVGSVFFVLTAVATFLLGARLFGVAAGLVASVAFTVNLSQLGFARSGLLETPAAFFIVATTLLLAGLLDRRADDTPRTDTGRAILLGILLGLATLLRYDLVCLTVGALAVLLTGGPSQRRRAWWVLGAAATPLLLWAAHNTVAVGSPFVFLGIDRNVLGTARNLDPYVATSYQGVWQVLAQNPEIVTDKLADLLWPLREWRRLFGSQHDWLGPAFLSAVVVLAARRHPATRLAIALLVGFLCRVVIFTVTHHEHRFYVSYAPVLLVLTVGGARELLLLATAGRTLPRRAGAVLAAAIVLLLLGRHVMREIDARRFAAVAAAPHKPDGDLFAQIRGRLPADAVLAGDSSEEIAWYGERAAIELLPGRLGEIVKRTRVDGLVYATSRMDVVRRSLARLALEEKASFELVYRDARRALWLRKPLAQRWARAGAAPVRADGVRAEGS